MSVAAIDIGTNSVRLLIAQQEGKQLKRLASKLETPRLGAGICQNDYLNQDAIERTIEVLKGYQKIVEQFDASSYVVATSAVRDATNQQEFLQQVKEETGFEIKVVSGEEEARLSYLGITSSITHLEEQVLAVDIGGGSTEFIYGVKDELEEYTSINLGAVRLTEKYDDDFDKINLVAEKMIKEAIDNKDCVQLLGVGGTVTTLVAIELELEPYNRKKVDGYFLTKSSIERIFNKLSCLSLAERKKIIGLQPKRADIILAGIIILLKIMEETNLEQIQVSEAGILEGIIQKHI
ncbi:Ppx/GppA family phosphatase [Natroniella sulfidigena]|uniref:Ppx/GppA phosphatase family protein n=1 Tax=Natroniella sulfidigena TaxID=723921 RepID=UPI00200AC1FB|nr:Ppx/GppA family phosphatase [Natroniella sulfidigena]MCK8817001.1 Ppx/GppA family phosphatase [Natroniella sulfidigena]